MSATLLVLVPTSTSLACPRCVVGITAREQVWSQDFARYLWAALLPFVVVAAVSLWCERASAAREGR